MKVSIVIRTLNEERYLEELLTAIADQKYDGDTEVVVVDSGSSDRTLAIADQYEARLTYIEKAEFSFGRSLNIGCAFSTGDILVFISGHCIPRDEHWLSQLVAPIVEKKAGYVYGRQVGRDTTKFSESRVFNQYFPDNDNTSTADFFCNNANSAIRRDVWEALKFDEDVTGLEDMELAQRYCLSGGQVSYVSQACVFHIHNENWKQTKHRYEREALALQSIAPEIYLSLSDALRFLFVAILHDCAQAIEERCLLREISSIVSFRFAQYWGSYLGSRRGRAVSSKQRMNYFYPRR